MTVLKTATGWAVATADTTFDPTLSSANHFVYTVSLYTIGANGQVARTTAYSTTLLPTRISTADLTGDGLDDIIVANSLDNSIQVAIHLSDRTFSSPITLSTGEAPSDITVAHFNGDGLPDIAVTNQATGDVSVFFNDKNHSFSQNYRFRAGTGLYGLDTTGAAPIVSSLAESASLASGDFTGTGHTDLVVVNRGNHSFTVLPGDGSGGFGSPRTALTTSTSDGPIVNDKPGPVVSGDFNRDGHPDLAILMEDTAQVWIYTNDGHGHFTHTFTIAAGTTPTGLSLYRNPETGLDDLLVGNPFGDILHLQGKGDGTFQLPGNRVSLDVQNLGNGKSVALVANQQTDRITIQAPQPGTTGFAPVVTLADGTQSTLAPGNVQWARLDHNSPYFDAIVVASGGNEVLVYRGTGYDASGNPTFAAPASYSVGTDPVSVTVANINGDGIPDLLVTDQGSNDVATLFGGYDSGDWSATAGPRLSSGGNGPVAANLIADAKSPGGFDLAVTNGQSGTVAVLPGRGQGFFDDRDPQVFNLGAALDQAPSVAADGQAVAVTDTGELLSFNFNDLSAHATVSFASAGESVLAAEMLADGDVVAAEADGAVVLLTSQANGLSVTETLVPLDGVPAEPSALAVLESSTGLTALVTTAGLDTVFVFASVQSLPLPTPPSTSLAVPQTVSESPLILVLTLQPPPLAVGEGIESIAGPGAGEGNEPGAVGIGPAPVGDAAKTAAVGGEDRQGQVRLGDPGLVDPVSAPAPGPEVDEALRQLERMLPGPGRGEGFSLLSPHGREDGGEWDMVVAMLAREMAVSERMEAEISIVCSSLECSEADGARHSLNALLPGGALPEADEATSPGQTERRASDTFSGDAIADSPDDALVLFALFAAMMGGRAGDDSPRIRAQHA